MVLQWNPFEGLIYILYLINNIVIVVGAVNSVDNPKSIDVREFSTVDNLWMKMCLSLRLIHNLFL